MSREVWVLNRRTGRMERETQFSAGLFHFLFDTKLGLLLSKSFFVKPWFSKLYGEYQDSSRTAVNIEQFVQEHGIRTEEYEDGPFSSFNRFFYRRFRPGQRPFPKTENVMGAPAEGRVLAYQNLSECPLLAIKGSRLTLEDLVQDSDLITPQMREGPVLIFRLSPLDYHRFHAPDDLKVLTKQDVPGDLFTVHPLGWKNRPDVFFQNQREWLRAETARFGPVLYGAIGGFVVGRIRWGAAESFGRGEEMGWFEMGGSTIVLVGEAGAFEIDADLLKNTSEGVETLVRLGEPVALAAKSR